MILKMEHVLNAYTTLMDDIVKDANLAIMVMHLESNVLNVSAILLVLIMLEELAILLLDNVNVYLMSRVHNAIVVNQIIGILDLEKDVKRVNVILKAHIALNVMNTTVNALAKKDMVAKGVMNVKLIIGETQGCSAIVS